MNKRKPTLTGLQREVKELSEQKYNLSRKYDSLEREKEQLLKDLKEAKRIESDCNYYRGIVTGYERIFCNFKTLTVESKDLRELGEMIRWNQ